MIAQHGMEPQKNLKGKIASLGAIFSYQLKGNFGKAPGQKIIYATHHIYTNST